MMPMLPGLIDNEAVIWVRREILRFAYKPGWRIEIHGICVCIRFRAEDTYNPGHMIEVAKTTPLWGVPAFNSEMFAHWLAATLKEVEVHESREWLKRDGAIYDNPHA